MTGKHAHAITYRLLADMIHSIYLSISTMLISKYHGIPILSVSLYGHSIFFLFLSYCQLVSKCSLVLPNIITPIFIYPAPLYTFAIFQCQLWTFEEFLLDVLLDLTARAIFPVLLHPLSFFPFHFFTGVTGIVHCLILQFFFSIWPSNQLSNLAKAG